MKSKRRMAAAEFEAVRPLLKISEDRTNAARMALVEGKTLQSIGEKYGWTRQAVGDSVNAVWRVLERYHESQRAAANAGALLPPGWEQVTLIAPTNLIDKFRAEIAKVAPQPVKKTENTKKPKK
jgi:predicted DNA-binding protein YlxM (UPF0122 family)